ncbi:MAG TPA: class I SAM-dependent methyltransferase [Puia sp.]|nr:class I SAM-dependent methyltransferase [Puia sp.]
MDNPQGSLTSVGAARLRAAHQLLDGSPKLLADPVILQLLDTGQLEEIRNNPGYFQEPRLLGLRSHIVLRSRYTEDRLAQAFARGIRQYLLLGAGLDTFAWRRPPGMSDLMVFEADHPATQEQKRQRLLRAGIGYPDHYERIPVNFEPERAGDFEPKRPGGPEPATLRDALEKSTFDLTVPSFVSCLGVMIYLSGEALDGIFRCIAGLPAGTEFVFTFGRRRSLPDMDQTASRVAEAGEPWRTFYEPDELEAKLRAMGYASIRFLEAAEAAALYYTGRAHGLPVPLRCSIATATV